MKSHFTKKEQIVILIGVGVIASIVGFKYFSSKFIANNKTNHDIVINADKQNDKNLLEDEDEPRENPEEEKSEGTHMTQEIEGDIIVHVSGQVKNPGIVELKSGKRLIDAVEMLGGLTDEADGDRINLAKKLQDEEKIYIPKIGEELQLAFFEVASDTSDSKTQDKQNFADNGEASDKIDINICTKEILNTLPGIGEVLSGRIIEYRESNLFTAIEDIMNVSGIGAKKFEGIKELIRVK